MAAVNVLVVSDLHYALPQFDWLVAQAPKFDLVVIAGDLLDISAHLEPDVQIVVVTKYLDRLRALTDVVVCSGNHDGDVKNEAGEFMAEWLQEARAKRLYVDHDSFHAGDDLVTVCPWWDGEVTREQMTDRLAGWSFVEKKRWIWVHHAPPDKTKVSWTGRKHAGDAYLLELIESYKPDIVLSGHIHNAPFHADGSWVSKVGSTWVFNPGRQIGPVPAFIHFDLVAMTADYLNLEGSSQRSLAM